VLPGSRQAQAARGVRRYAPPVQPTSARRVVGRYAVYDEIASGGMATVHVGRLLGPDGFSRAVAIKRLHAHLAKDPEFVAMFKDEARLAARIAHPNVVATLDIVTDGDELFVVMDYVHGESLLNLLRRLGQLNRRMDVPITCAVVAGVLHGLHAAHEATNERGEPLRLVHRDVSPPNILVGLDGVARVADFGVAKAIGRAQTTKSGALKGKLPYMAPEQVRNRQVSRATDIYAASAVLWELLTGQRLFVADSEAGLVEKILFNSIEAPLALVANVPEELNAITLRGLARDPSDRYATAREMAREIEEKVGVAGTAAVGEWVESLMGSELAKRADLLHAVTRSPGESGTSPRVPAEGRVSGVRTSSAMPPSHADGGTDAALFLHSEPGPGRAAWRRWVRYGALACAALGATAFIAIREFHPRSSAAPVATVGQAKSASAAPPPTPPTGTAVRTEGTPTREPPVMAVESLPAVHKAPDSSSAAAVAPMVRPSPRPRRSAPAPAAAEPRPCNPPYVDGPDGTRRYKVECL
jgi:serine/threonine protein kinase